MTFCSTMSHAVIIIVHCQMHEFLCVYSIIVTIPKNYNCVYYIEYNYTHTVYLPKLGNESIRDLNVILDQCKNHGNLISQTTHNNDHNIT